MSAPIVNPEIPYNGSIPGGLQPGKMCRVQGVTHPNTDRFNINLQTGPNNKPRDDTALHISVRLKQGYVARNTYQDGAWDDEQGNGKLPIGPAQAFEILLLVEPDHYMVAINGQHFCEFPHRIPFSDVTHLLIEGDVSITLISWEGAKQIIEAAASQLNSEGSQAAAPQPQENFGAPPPGYNPQQQYGPPPGGYGPPPAGYGPPPAGYGPPLPPGAQPETGFESFLEQAQSVLAGAIKSGAAEKLLGGLLSSGQSNQQPQGQGYVPQNAQYGIYPELPREDRTRPVQQSQGLDLTSLLQGLLSTGNDSQYRNQPGNYGGNPSQNYQPNQQSNQWPEQNLQDQFRSSNPQGGQSQQQYGQYPGPPPSQEQKGPLENLLSGLLSGGGGGGGGGNQQQYHQPNPSQPHVPQIGGEGSVGGLGSMGGILSKLAGNILHNPKDGNQYQN